MSTLISDEQEENVQSIRIERACRDAEDLYEQIRRIAAEAGFDGEFYALAAAQRRIAERLIQVASQERES